MDKKISISKGKKTDFSEVFALLQQLRTTRKFTPKALQATFGKAIHSSNQHYFCARYGNKIVGFGSFSIKQGLYAMGNVAILDELIVDEKHRKMGIAKQLLDHMVKFAKGKKCLCIELECGAKRLPAHSFYEKYGFYKGNGYFFSLDLV